MTNVAHAVPAQCCVKDRTTELCVPGKHPQVYGADIMSTQMVRQ
jgi:hypothetical protein